MEFAKVKLALKFRLHTFPGCAAYAEGCAAYADGCAAYAEGCASYAEGCAAFVKTSTQVVFDTNMTLNH